MSQKDKSKTVLFIGCTGAYRRTEIAENTVKILNKLGIPFSLMEDEWCCGSPLLRTGQQALAKEMAMHNLEELKGVETVITSCAGCARAFKRDYPKMGLEVPFNVMHITEFLNGLLDEGKLKLKTPVKMKITYHDPCHMGRHLELPLYDEPRNLLKAIPGIELVEMFQNKDSAWCCGAGGGFKTSHSDLAVEIATDRVGHAKEVGAEAIVSSCPFCKTNLSDGVKAAGARIKVYDITELIAKSLGI